MKKFKRAGENKGITLVALVITIVILLILAGISISALTNQGLFGKAKEANEKSKKAEIEEKIELIKYQVAMETDNTSSLKKKMIDEKLIDENDINQKRNI